MVAILSISVSVVADEVNKAESSRDEEKKVSLQMSTVIGEPRTTLALTVINNTKEELKTWPLGLMRSNCLTIIKPNGEEKELWVGVDSEIDAVTVKPAQSFTWKVDVSRRIGLHGGSFKEPGIYRVYWTLEDLKAEGVAKKYKSNEILLLKEKDAEP